MNPHSPAISGSATLRQPALALGPGLGTGAGAAQTLETVLEAWTGPLLILHGGVDEVVPVEDAHAIHANAGGPKALKVLPGGDHRFTRPEDLEEVVNAARDWFKEHLKR